MFRFLILGLLRHRARMHGYALVKEYRERSGAEVSTGNFYRELQRLMSDGLIRSATNPPEADARRTPYEITDEGISTFDEWFTDQRVAAGSFAEDDISARALFVPDLDPSVVANLLDRLQDNLWFWGKRLERDRQLILSRADQGKRHGSFAVLPMLLARRLRYISADLDFVEDLRSKYKTWLAAHRPEAAGAVGPGSTRTRASQKREVPMASAVGRRA